AAHHTDGQRLPEVRGAGVPRSPHVRGAYVLPARRACRPGEARDALVGGAHDASVATDRWRAPAAREEGRPGQCRGAVAESDVSDLNARVTGGMRYSRGSN